MMKRFIPLLVMVALTGCSDLKIPDISLNCKGSGQSLMCSWFGPSVDAGAPVADSGIDSSIPNVDPKDSGPTVSTDAGQSVDSSVVVVSPPPKDAGQPPAPSAANRPATSLGTGLFVVGSKVYDGNGKEFRFRGTNKTHIDSWAPSLGLMPSNATRFISYFYSDPDRVLRDMKSPNIGGTTVNGKDIMVPGLWDSPGGILTCRDSLSAFNAGVDVWVRDAVKYQTMERSIVLNVANEWGNDSTAWRDAYVAALPRIRAAGWHGLIMVDAPGCGQNATPLVTHGAAILAADPEHNVVFSWHIYGSVFDSLGGKPKQWSEQLDLVPTMDALRATGLAVILGEFGPVNGSSPQVILPQRIVEQAEAHGFGWLTWSYDDWSDPNETGSETSFAHLKQGNTYNSDADLTKWGRDAKALWLQYGAATASTF